MSCPNVRENFPLAALSSQLPSKRRVTYVYGLPERMLFVAICTNLLVTTGCGAPSLLIINHRPWACSTLSYLFNTTMPTGITRTCTTPTMYSPTISPVGPTKVRIVPLGLRWILTSAFGSSAIAGAAGFAAMKAYESHLRATGEHPSHEKMKVR